MYLDVGIEQGAAHVSAVDRVAELNVLPELALGLLGSQVLGALLLGLLGGLFAILGNGKAWLLHVSGLEGAFAALEELQDWCRDDELLGVARVALRVARRLPLRRRNHLAQTVLDEMREDAANILGEVAKLVHARAKGWHELHGGHCELALAGDVALKGTPRSRTLAHALSATMPAFALCALPLSFYSRQDSAERRRRGRGEAPQVNRCTVLATVTSRGLFCALAPPSFSLSRILVLTIRPFY